MLMKCYHHFHLVVESKVCCANQTINENCSLDIFQQIGNSSELTKENVINELVIFKGYQLNPKYIKCFLQ
jgi:hypothetical protein